MGIYWGNNKTFLKRQGVLKYCENRNLGDYWGITGELLRELLSHIFIHYYFPPFCYTLHWFPFYPRKYRCSLVETIIIHMYFSIIRTGFFRERFYFILNPRPTRFATQFFQMMRTLFLKDTPRVTVHLQEFILLKLRK